ncbi:hypothetical protein ACFXDJ_25375 [Streptomyces sp. NPDC059443]|uniref:hypothetical protein n=1 Tax=unclassified Streptomyces TaxID=2593676 RepID=UPI003690261C
MSAKKWQPSYAQPESLTLPARAGEWRTSIVTDRRAIMCGRLRSVPGDADPEEARQTAAEMVRGLCREFHDVEVTVTWEEPGAPDGWWARIAAVGGAEAGAPAVS